MDTEGAEWGVIRDISSETLSKFAQITFEFHNVASLYFLDYEETLAIFEKLNRTHQVIWIHANNFGTVEQAGDILMPDTLEITYANRNYYQFQPCEYSCPLSIDEPNHSLRPDVELDNFGTKNMESEISNTIQKELFKFYEIDRDNKGMDIGCEAKINNQDFVVIRLSDKLNEQESVIDNQNNKLNEQRSVIDDQNNKLNEQRSVIENQNTKLDEQHSVIEYQNAKLKEQSNIIENQYSEIQTRENRISVLTVETREKSDTIDALRQQLEQTKNELDSLYNSRSWKITTPLRKIFTFFRKVFKREK